MNTRTLSRCLLPFLALGDRRPATPDAIRQAQKKTLHHLMAQLRYLPIGVMTGLNRLPMSHALVDAFREQIPVSTYEDVSALIQRSAAGEADVMFPGTAVALAQTSGTTSAHGAGERFIPQSSSLLDHHARGGAAALTRLMKMTGMSMLDGQMLMLGGSTSLVNNKAGIPVGDLSGISAMRIPWWLRSLYEPGLDIALENNWERKLTRIADRCSTKDIRLVSGIPAWCLMLFERICAYRRVSRLRTAWPQLSGFIHGGHSIAPFTAGLRDHLPIDTWLLEVYPASEAFIGVGCRPWQLDEGLPPPIDLLCNHGIFLEFLPEDGGAIVGPESIESGRLYRVLVTTPGGLIRYQLGDLVLGVEPGRVLFAGRIKTRISVFGEHVEGIHLEAALHNACASTAAEVSHYHVAPILPSTTCASGCHEWLIEFSRMPDNMDMFTETLDRHLKLHVLDYEAHRSGTQLDAPRISSMPKGTFHSYLASAGKLGGQHKVPQAWNDRSIADAIVKNAKGFVLCQTR